MKLLNTLKSNGVINPPPFLIPNLCYLTQMGSHAYGCNNPDSDFDYNGITINPKNTFLYEGLMAGFDELPNFEKWNQIVAEYDFTVYGLIYFCKLTYKNNPNFIDMIFTPARCVVHMTGVGEHIRNNRKLFLSQKAFTSMRSYAYSQLGRLDRIPDTTSTRGKYRVDDAETGKEFDTKFAYHIVRTALEAEQIIENGDLELDRDKEVYKSIRRGEWTIKQIRDWFSNKEKILDQKLQNCSLPKEPDHGKIRKLIVECLEIHYGRLDAIRVADPTADSLLLQQIRDLLK